MNKPLVSIRFMVYNNAPYIKEAIESVLMQQTNFKVELVVGDDFSTDNTLDIIKSYRDTENISIKILDRPIGGQYWKDRKRLGRLHNFIDIIENCTGKYIALLDGDDYWTDPLKLQKQVDFLEANKNYAIVFTNGKVDYSDNSNSHLIYVKSDYCETAYKMFDVPPETSDIYKLAKGNYIHTAGTLFRNWVKEESVPDYMYQVSIGDWPLYMFTATKGLIFYMNEETFGYRIHNSSIYSKKSESEKLKMSLGQFAPILNSFFFDVRVRDVITKYCTKSSKIYLSTCKNKSDYNFFINFIESFNDSNKELKKELLQLLKDKKKVNKTLYQKNYYRLKSKIKRLIKYFI
jgi:glycosyltransferase involved in cell wall biosynthesis